jgi:hypothetical protein
MRPEDQDWPGLDLGRSVAHRRKQAIVRLYGSRELRLIGRLQAPYSSGSTNSTITRTSMSSSNSP